MNEKKIGFLYLVFGMLGLGTAVAAEKYGNAQIESGTLTVVRGGTSQEFASSPDPVAIEKNDVLRTGPGTNVVLVNQDQTRITMGSNAILQTKEWKRKDSNGFVRMLFGKFKALTSEETKKDANILTTTGVIGIKGSEGHIDADSDRTVLSNISGNMDMGGSSIDPGQSGLTVDGKEGLAAAFSTPEGATDSVNTPDAKATEIPAGVSQTDLGGITEVQADEATIAPSVSPPSATQEDEADEAAAPAEEKKADKPKESTASPAGEPRVTSVEEVSSAVNAVGNVTSGYQDNTNTQTTEKAKVGVSVEK